MKDNFSAQAAQYKTFRPSYPAALFHFLLSMVRNRDAAWDCGTGNGQVAQELSKYFSKVYATDISEAQITNAAAKGVVSYRVEPAEKTTFPDNIFDLITVAQAIHWFQFESFYEEVKRTMKTGGLLAVIGYGLIRVEENIDTIIDSLYHDIVGPYWDKERKYIDELYQTIPFPFSEISTPSLSIQLEWTGEQCVGYLQTWSAVQHFIKAHHQNPIALIDKDLQQAWPLQAIKTVRFPLLLRIGRVEK